MYFWLSKMDKERVVPTHEGCCYFITDFTVSLPTVCGVHLDPAVAEIKGYFADCSPA